MSHLTEATLGFASAERYHLRDSYDWHQAVWKAFPGRDGQPRDYLTRLDRRKADFRLLIVSPVPPVRPEWCPPDGASWKTKPIPNGFFSRSHYLFQLCANPTKKVTKQRPDGSLTKNGSRLPLHTREELLGWIQRKGAQGGFTVDESQLKTFVRGRGYFHKPGHNGLHSAVDFQGVLAVSDPVRFRAAFTAGIGSAKAFGFGLLVLAPIS